MSGVATTEAGSNGEPIVSIVIVTWKSRHLIDRCLAPLAGHDETIEVLVHDNDSPDGTAEYIATNYPWVRLTSGKENLGFGRANNALFALCRGRYVLMLNPDAFLDDLEPVNAMAKHLDVDPSVAIVGPQLVHEDGRHQVGDGGWRTTLGSITGHAFWIHRALPSVPSIYIANPKLLSRDLVDVDWICGACLMARREVLEEVGGFADDIFMYGEDVDLGVRVKQRGHRVVYLPRFKVLHVQGATQKADGTVHYSARWMDARAHRFARERSRSSYWMLKAILAAGFGMRSALLALVGIVKPGARAPSKMMGRFAAHAASLPSYDAQRVSSV